jgi:hypothetical protein
VALDCIFKELRVGVDVQCLHHPVLVKRHRSGLYVESDQIISYAKFNASFVKSLETSEAGAARVRKVLPLEAGTPNRIFAVAYAYSSHTSGHPSDESFSLETENGDNWQIY